jgi:hypothetical protein
MPSQSEHPDSEPEPEQEPQPIDPGILLEQTAIDEPQKAPGESTQRTSARSNKGTITSKKFADETYEKAQRIRLAKMARHMKDPNDEDEPETVKEALNHPEGGKQWEKAIQDEVNANLKNHAWDIVPRPRNRQVVSNKFAFKHKKNELAIIVRLKARLVARGFSQIYGVDYLDTYAPVVKLTSIRILLAIAAIYGLEILQMDVVTAFLAGELEEEIYMEQPEGFEIGSREDFVCRLRKSIYGLKQAPRVWNEKIRRFLKSIGFEQLCLGSMRLCQQGIGNYSCNVGGRSHHFRKGSQQRQRSQGSAQRGIRDEGFGRTQVVSGGFKFIETESGKSSTSVNQDTMQHPFVHRSYSSGATSKSVPNSAGKNSTKVFHHFVQHLQPL